MEEVIQEVIVEVTQEVRKEVMEERRTVGAQYCRAVKILCCKHMCSLPKPTRPAMVRRRTVGVDYRRFWLERLTEHRTYVRPAQTYQAGHGAPPRRTYVQLACGTQCTQTLQNNTTLPHTMHTNIPKQYHTVSHNAHKHSYTILHCFTQCTQTFPHNITLFHTMHTMHTNIPKQYYTASHNAHKHS